MKIAIQELMENASVILGKKKCLEVIKSFLRDSKISLRRIFIDIDKV
jgi:hypothetical protein